MTHEQRDSAAARHEILTVARDEKRTVVTLDGDFSGLLARSGASGPSVIHIRLQGLDRLAAVALLRGIVERYAAELRGGCIASVGQEAVRIRALPVSSS